MDTILQQNMEQKKEKFTMDTFKLSDEQLKTNATAGMKQMENLVENQFFAGQQEQQRQAAGDFMHGHVMASVQKQLDEANFSVKMNIDKYDKAELTDEEKKAKLQKKKAPGMKLVNKPAKAAGWKQNSHEKSMVDAFKDVNKNIDIGGVREMESLDKANEKMMKYINKEDSTYSKALRKALDSVEDGKKKDREAQLHKEMVYGAMPFLKFYKKGWFGRKYTLDGRRIKTKSGELAPDEYNKKILQTLTLETRKLDSKNGVKLDDKKLKENREKKAEVLGMITKELLDYKLDVNKLTDEYLADHIVEIQQYADKLTAFHHLFNANTWYFYGNEKKNMEQAEDKTFLNLIKTRIFVTGSLLNEYLDAHYRSHGVRRNHYDVAGSDVTKLDGGKDMQYHDRAGFLRERYKNQPMDQGTLSGMEREQARGLQNAFDFFDASTLTEEERAKYEANVATERQNADVRLNKMKEELEKNEKSFQAHLGAEIQNTIKKRMDKEAETTLKRYQDLVKENPDHYKDIPYIKYESGATGMENAIMLGDAKAKLLKNPKLYAAFGPEMDNIYARLYATARLSAELSARKRVLHNTLYDDSQRTAKMEEYGAKMKDSKHYVVDDMKKQYNKAAKNKIFKYQSKNAHITYISDAVEEHMREAAQTEHDGIDKQLEYLRYNEKVCRKVIKFLSEGAKGLANKDDMKEVSNFLRAEKMGYLLEYHKIDEYNELMNDAINKARKRIHKEDIGGDGIKAENVNEEEKLITEEERVEKVYKSRKFATKRNTLLEAEAYFSLVQESSTELFKWVALCTPNELAEFDLNWNMPAGSVREALPSLRAYYRSTKIYLMLTGNDPDKFFRKNDLYDRKIMRNFYEQLQKTGHVRKEEKFLDFMTRMQLSFEMISKIALKNRAIYKMNTNDNYALFDMERIKDMSIEELKALESEFDEKIKAEEEKNKQNVAMPFDRLLELEEKATRLKEVKSMIQDYRLGVEAAKDYTRVGSDSYNNLFKQRKRQNRIKYLKGNKFFAANETYLDIEDMFNENAEYKAAFELKLFDYTSKRNANPNADIDVAKAQSVIEKATQQLVSIPLDDSLIEMVNTLSMDYRSEESMDQPVDTNVLAKLIRFCSILGSFDLFDEDYPEEYLSQEHKDLREVLNRKENAKLKLTIETRKAALDPMYIMVKSFLAAHGFDGLYSNKLTGMSGDDIAEGRITRAKAFEELQQSMEKAKEQREKFIANINDLKTKGVENLLADNTNELFERIYKSGEKLSINNMSAWKKKIEAMTRKGFFEKDTENGKWLRIAAQNMLDNWPYSFEEFYRVRIQKDTGKALKATIENYGGKEAGKVLDIENAALYSEIITENEIHKYTALNEEDRKNLDRRLVANGYDPNLIKIMFKPVNLNGANMPATYTDRYNRQANKELMDLMYKGMPVFNKELTETKKVTGENYDYVGFEWAYKMRTVMLEALATPITSEMLNEDYIAKNFKTLYENAQRFALAKHFYDKHKAYWNSDNVSNLFLGKKEQIAMHNGFDLEGNSIYARFYDMISAFAKMHMVDENGGFDIGLSNAEINAKKTDQKANLEKMQSAVNERKALFEKARDIVGAEIRRGRISKQVAKSDQVNSVLNAIQIKGNDKALRVAAKMDFEGDIRDINLLVQDNYMTGLVNDYVEAGIAIEEDKKQVSKYNDLINELTQGSTETQAEIERVKGEGGDTSKLERKYDNFRQKIAEQTMKKAELEVRIAQNTDVREKNESSISQYQNTCMSVYSLYNNCHDKKGKLIDKITIPNSVPGEKPVELDTTTHFHEFHKSIAVNMRDIYREFKDGYEDMKKSKVDFLDRQRIANSMLNVDFPNNFRRYKQLNLYFGLLEQDAKSFSETTGFFSKKKDPFVKTFEDRKAQADKKMKEFKNYKEEEATNLQKTQYKKAVREKKGCDDAYFMLNEAFKDKEVINALHDYIRQVNAVIAMHGVSSDGQFIDSVVAKESEGYYNEKQQKMIAHDYQDKGRELAKQIQENANKKK